MSFFKSSGNTDTYWGPENAKIFLVLYGITGYFFATKMARLIILMGPIASALSGIALGWLANWVIAQFALLVWPDKEVEDAAPVVVADTKGGKGKDLTPKKGPRVKAVGLSDQVKSITDALNVVYRSKKGQNYRIGAALASVFLVTLYATTFYNYR